MPMSETTSTIVTGIATVATVVGVVTLAVLHPEAILDTVVVENPRPTVVVNTPPVAPMPGVPAYSVPVGQPYVVYGAPTTVRLPRAYKSHYTYVMHGGVRCPIVLRNNQWCYKVGNRFYPVVYF